jgi:hypothetical protein
MQTKRIFWFLVMIVIGVAVGLVYGWVINPVKHVDSSAESLRADYKTDYVLMVAEIYQSDRSLDGATARLGLVSSASAGIVVNEALQTARSLGYSPADLALLETLTHAMQKETPAAPNEDQP